MSIKIAESTNSQTPIKLRDLRANDEVQRKLAESFQNLGYFYERKANQHRDKEKTRRIDALSAGQAYTAYTLGIPSVASTQRGRIFGDRYDDIFNEDLTAESLLTPLQIFRPIETKKRCLQSAIRQGEQYDASLLFLIDGAYHLLYAIGCLCTSRGIDKSNSTSSLNQLENAIEVVKEAVERESTDLAFALKRFFKSARAQRYIDDAVKKITSIANENTEKSPPSHEDY